MAADLRARRNGPRRLRRPLGHRPKGIRRDQRRGPVRLAGAARRASRHRRLSDSSGLYNLVFGYRDCDPDQRGFAAGVAVFLSASGLFQHRGALFWKMTAGMGDVVIAPIYQALRRRGVEFEFFHRVDALHLDAKHQAVEAISMGRQVELVDGTSHYEPLTRVRGLPVFPDRPLADQVRPRPGIDTLESHFGSRDDVEHLVLRRGVDFDHVVLALSVGMVKIVAGELIDDRPEWRDMTDHIAHRRHPGLPDLAAPRRTQTRLGRTRRHHQRLRPAVRHLGVHATDAVDRGLARIRPARRRRLLLRSTRRGMADDTRSPRLRRGLRATGPRRRRRTPRPPHRALSAWRDDRARIRLADPCLHRRADGHRRDRDPTRQRQHRPVRPLRAVAARHRPLPAAARRIRLRQPGSGGRLDRLGAQRRLHRVSGAVRPAGGERTTRQGASLPDPAASSCPEPPFAEARLLRYAATC